MSIIWDCYGNSAAVRIETRYARALLIPAVPITPADQDASQAFAARLAARQAEGYAEEDAATLALFEMATLAKSASLIDARCFPRLVDLDLSPDAADQRLAGIAFSEMKDPQPGIYPIVDQLAMLEELLDADARMIQLRIKSEELTPDIDRTIARAIRLADQYPQAQLFINDYWQSAIEHGAYGVHLGQEDLLDADLNAVGYAGLRLGVSSHAYWEVARALTIKPSYIACGPVFPTRAKVMPWISQGIGNLAYWVKLIPHPVVGIGGINASNLADVRATGCASASLIQAIVSEPHPALAYQRLQRAWLSENPVNRAASGAGADIPIAGPTLTPASA